MKPKEIFWSGLKGGIFDQKHFRAMGNALWLFGWLCMRQSQVNESGEGLPHYGNPLTFQKISEDTGFSRRTIEKWTAVLTRAGYIHTKRIGNSGMIFFIHKAKSKARDPKPKTRYFPAELQPNGNYKARENVTSSASPQVPANGRTPGTQVPANEGDTPRQWAYTCADKPLDSQSDAPITNTLIPKHLSNYKTEARSLSSLARQKQVPRGKSQAELDERRRELLQQAERIKQNYPAKESSLGMVVPFQKEATA